MPNAGPGAPAGGCGYVQAMVDQSPRYDNQVRKRMKPRKKKKKAR